MFRHVLHHPLFSLVCSSLFWVQACADRDVGQTLLNEDPRSFSLFEIPQTLDRIDSEIEKAEGLLATLPALSDSLQFDAYGYHGGYLPKLSELPEEPRWTVDIEFLYFVQLMRVVLVPALDHRFSRDGSYGFPKRFRIVEVLENGATNVVEEWMKTDCPDPGRVPLIVDIESPQTNKIRIEVFKGAVEGDNEFFALDEFFGVSSRAIHRAFEISTNLEFESLPYWGKAFLLDQKTNLGQPVAPLRSFETDVEVDEFVVTFDKDDPIEGVLEIDLGSNRNLGWVTLYPALPPEGILIPGYGFPGRLHVEVVSETPEGGRGVSHRVKNSESSGNPGNNVVRIPCSSRSGRWIRIFVSDFPVHDGKRTFAMGEVNTTRRDNVYPIDKVRLEGFPREAEKSAYLMVDKLSGGRPIMFLLDWLVEVEERSRISRTLSELIDMRKRLDERLSVFWRRSGVVVVLLILLAVVCAVKLVSLNRRRQAKALRQQITLDLHDDIGSRLSAISLASTYLQRVSKEPLIHERSGKIQRMAGEMQSALSDVLWFTNSDTDSLDQLLEKLMDIANQSVSPDQLSLKEINLKHVPDSTVDVRFKRDLLLIFREMIHNAVKHANADEIGVSVVYEKRRLRISVVDDGKGFDVNIVQHEQSNRPHLGLRSMARRTKRLGGELKIDSHVGEGCAISFSVKI